MRVLSVIVTSLLWSSAVDYMNIMLINGAEVHIYIIIIVVIVTMRRRRRDDGNESYSDNNDECFILF